MKNTLVTLIAASAFIVSSKAAILQGGSVVNLDGLSPDTVILGLDDLGLASGFYGVGYFDLTDLEVTNAVSISDFATLNSAFVSLASDDFQVGLPNLLGVDAVAGLSAIFNAGFDPTNGIGRTMYTYVTDSSALGGSDLYALYQHSGIVFSADPGSPPATTYTASLEGGALLVGTFEGPKLIDVTDVGPVVFGQSIRLIPEPSAVLLGVIGGLGLLRRRRN